LVKGSVQVMGGYLGLGGIAVAHRAHYARRHKTAHSDIRRGARLFHLLEVGIALYIGARPALPDAAEPGHAVTDVEEETLALLLAVVDYVDAGFELAADGRAHRLAPGGGDRRRIHCFAARPSPV